jgi:alkylation response protein AidB-like acyl-CoA dehydrogenase
MEAGGLLMSDTEVKEQDVEPVEEFRHRARTWLKENMPPVEPVVGTRGELSDEQELADVQWNRQLQRRLFDGGFAGLVVPEVYGGQGLTAAHAEAFNEEIVGYQYPVRLQIPPFTPCMAVILEFGTHEQKLAHVPAILKGEEIWMQMLSEPSGGSDVAGAQTTAIKDGDEWRLNGSKIWTTGAWWSDWALCLTRTNWDVPKHRGLTVFMVPFRTPGLEMHRIEMLNGSKEFCQEFMTDVRIPDSDRIGAIDEGWTVGTRWMFYEKSFAISPLIIRPRGRGNEQQGPFQAGGGLRQIADAAGRAHDPVARQLIGESHALNLVQAALANRIASGIRARTMSDQAATLTRLMSGVNAVRQQTIAFELAGSAAIAWGDDDPILGHTGVGFLMRQTSCIAGGTTEMARNVISERVLGMPRERTVDRDIPFRDVPKSAPSRA